MSLIDIKYWYEDLEAIDKLKLAGILAAALVLLTPWRKDLSTEAAVKPKEGELTILLSPGQGFIKEMQTEKGKVLAPGDPIFIFAPQQEMGSYASRFYNQGYSNSTSTMNNGVLATAYQDEEKRIRDRYRQQIADANAYTASYQQQLNRAYQERGNGRSNNANEIQLAQNALNRAQQAPYELARKQEQELAAVRNQRATTARAVQFSESPLANAYRPTYAAPSGSETPITATERSCVWTIMANARAQVAPGQECVALLTESAAVEITAALPAAFAKDLRVGAQATLEIVLWMHDSEIVNLRLEKIGNRNLDRAEVVTLSPKAPADTPYVLVTFSPLTADPRLFPPPANCKLHLAGSPRCLLQRLIF